MRIHSGEKPYHTIAFPSLESLIIHLGIHSGEQPFPCNQCPKTFSMGSSLRIHLSVLSGENPYPRNLCSQAFTQLGYLDSQVGQGGSAWLEQLPNFHRFF